MKTLGRKILMVWLAAAVTSPLLSQTCRVLLDQEATQEASFYDCFGGSNMHLNVVLDDRSDRVKLRLLDRNYRDLDEEFDGSSLETDYREGTYYIEARLDTARANCTYLNREITRDTIRYIHEEIRPEDISAEDVQVIEISDCGQSDGEIRVTDWPGIEYRVTEVSSVWRATGIFRGLSGGSYRLKIRDSRTRCESNNFIVEIKEPSPTVDQDQIEIVEPSACGLEDGSITIDLPAGVEMNFQSLGWSTEGTYEGLGAGEYSFTLRNPQVPECTSNAIAVTLGITAAPDLQFNQITVADESQCQANDGSITIDHPTDGLEYSIGGEWIANAVFNDLTPGFYQVKVRSNASEDCQSNSIQVEVKAAQAPILRSSDISTRAETLCGRADGGILVANKGSTIEYGIDGVFGQERMFSNLTPGTYQIAIRPTAAPDCISTVFEVVIETSGAPSLAPSEIVVNNEQNCAGNDGSIIIQSELTDIEYGLDGSFGGDPNFAGLAPGIYEVQIRAVGEPTCVSEIQAVFIDSVKRPKLDIADFQLSQIQQCGQADGIITYDGTTANLEFSLAGDNFIPGGQYDGLAAGSYSLIGRIIGSAECTTNEIVLDLIEPGAPVLDQNSISTTDPTDCGTQDGTITIDGFEANFSSSIDGGSSFNQQLSYSDLAAGLYMILVQDPNGCTSSEVEVLLEAAGAPVLSLDDFDIFGESACGSGDGSISVLNLDFEFQIAGVSDFTTDVFDLGAGSYEVEYRRIDMPECSNVIAIDLAFSQADIVLKFAGSLNMLVYPDSTLDYLWGTVENGDFSELPPVKNDRQYYLLEDSYDPNTTYAVMLFCGDQAELVLFDGPQLTDPEPIEVYPNPTQRNLTIKGASDARYRIYDSVGRLFDAGTLHGQSNVQMIDVSDLSEGLFRLVITSTSNIITSIPFIKI